MSATTTIAAAKATPFIDWAAFWKVAGVSLVFGLGLVILFSLGVVGLSMAKGKVDESSEGGIAVRGGRGVGSVLAGTCFVLCAAAVLYGLYLEIPQFH
jgi:hypothetical protein